MLLLHNRLTLPHENKMSQALRLPTTEEDVHNQCDQIGRFIGLFSGHTVHNHPDRLLKQGSLQRTLTIEESIAVRLASYLTGLHLTKQVNL